MAKKIVWLVISCLMTLTLILASCSPAEEEETETGTGNGNSEVVITTENGAITTGDGEEML